MSPLEKSGDHLRFHALDGLLAMMMLLGLVLHAACNYQDSPPDEAWSVPAA